MLGRKNKLKFKGKTHSLNGIASMWVGITVVISFALLAAFSAGEGGNGGFGFGVAAMFGFFVAIFGFLIGIVSFQERDVYYVAPIIGSGINGVMFLTYLILYIIGVMS